MTETLSIASGSPEGDPPLLKLEQVVKRFPGVLALDHVDFELRAGEVHVLFGENGAGKSTLISLIAGVCQPDSGTIRLNGTPVHLHSVHDARGRGIGAVFQEFSLVEQLTVEQNLFLGAEQTIGPFLNRKALHRQAQRILADLGFALKATQKVAYLSRAEQQMVEIAKAFRSGLSILILDEPTASLTDNEAERLFHLIETVKANGAGIIYITHRLAEIRRIGDRVTVLRDGHLIDTVPAATPENELIRLMTGRVIDQLFPVISSCSGETRLRIDNLHTRDGTVRGATLEVRAGEVVGLAGLVGSGKSEIMRACFGLKSVAAGRVLFNGQDVTGANTRAMLEAGFFYSPPDRRVEGLVMIRNCRENITLASLKLPIFGRRGMIDRVAEHRVALRLATKMQLQPLRVDREVDHFSGGNQQKILLAKCLTREIQLYVFDEPTVGVDVGTRAEIYGFIGALCEAGSAVVVISSDLPEILHLPHRVYVMYRGVLQAELTGEAIRQETVLGHFFEREAA